MIAIIIWASIALTVAALFVLAREDWPFLTRRRVRTLGTVYDHVRGSDEGSEHFSARVRFLADDGRLIEITDTLPKSTPTPPTGTIVPLSYPTGMPEKARIPRVGLRLVIYCALLGLLAVLLARLFNLIE